MGFRAFFILRFVRFVHFLPPLASFACESSVLSLYFQFKTKILLLV